MLSINYSLYKEEVLIFVPQCSHCAYKPQPFLRYRKGMFFRFSKLLPNRLLFLHRQSTELLSLQIYRRVIRCTNVYNCTCLLSQNWIIVFDTVFSVAKTPKSLIEWNKYVCLIGKELANALDGILELQRSFFLKNFSGSNVVVTPPYFTAVKTCQRSECGQTTKDEAPKLVKFSQLSENTCGNDIKKSSVLLANYWSLFVQTVRGLKYPEECAP